MIAFIVVFLLAVDSTIEGHGVGAVADFAVFNPVLNASAYAIPVLLLDDQPEIHSDADGVDLGVGDVTHPCRRLFQLHIDSCFTFHRREAVDRLLLRGAVAIFQCNARNVYRPIIVLNGRPVHVNALGQVFRANRHGFTL